MPQRAYPPAQLGTALPIVRNSWGPKTHELRQTCVTGPLALWPLTD